MRSADFSLAPATARTEAVVVSTAARRAPGSPTRNLRLRQRTGNGVIALYRTAAAAEAAAAVLRETGRGTTIVLYAARHGFTNGTWNAESGSLESIESFTPTSAERERGKQAPPVVRAGDDGRPPKRRRTRSASAATDERRTPPDATAAGAMFLGATKYTSPVSWIAFFRQWVPMVERMERMSGYRGHRVYWLWPFTLGTIAFFDRRDTMLAMARGPEHRYLMTWLTRSSRWATAGYIRFLEERSRADAGR